MMMKVKKLCANAITLMFLNKITQSRSNRNLFVLFSCLFIWSLTGVFQQEAHAQNRCPPGQREITILGVPNTGPPACSSKIPKGTFNIPSCPKTTARPSKRFIPGLNVQYRTALPKENGHRYIGVGPGKFAKIYLGRCLDINNSIEIHNGERVVVKNANRQKAGDIGRACFNNRCGIIFLADLKPLSPPPVAGRRANEDAGKIEGLNEKFYVAVPANKKLYLFSQPKFSGKPLAKLSNGTPLRGTKNNHAQDPAWKKVCTTETCGFVYSQFLKRGTPKDMSRQRGQPRKVITISAREITVFAAPDGHSKRLGAVYKGQIVDANQTVTNEEGVTWTKICKNGCGWVPTEDLRGSKIRTIR